MICCARVFFDAVGAALRVAIEAGQTKGLILRQFSGLECPGPWRPVPPLPFFVFFWPSPPSRCHRRFLLSGCLWPLRPPPVFFFLSFPVLLLFFLLRVCSVCSGVSCCVFPVLPVRCAVRVVCAVSAGWCCWFLVSLPFVGGLLVALVARRCRLVVCVGSGARVWSGRCWASSLWCPVPLCCVLWRCAAVLLRVVPLGVALLCTVLFRFALFGAAARRAVSWGAVLCLGVLCLLAPCFVLSPRAACVLLWCVAAWCCPLLCFVPCAPSGVVLCVFVVSALCGVAVWPALPRCPASLCCAPWCCAAAWCRGVLSCSLARFVSRVGVVVPTHKTAAKFRKKIFPSFFCF